MHVIGFMLFVYIGDQFQIKQPMNKYKASLSTDWNGDVSKNEGKTEGL